MLASIAEWYNNLTPLQVTLLAVTAMGVVTFVMMLLFDWVQSKVETQENKSQKECK